MVESCVIPSLRCGSLWTVVYVLSREGCCVCTRLVRGSLQWLSGEYWVGVECFGEHCLELSWNWALRGRCADVWKVQSIQPNWSRHLARGASAWAAPLARLKATPTKVLCDNCSTVPFLAVLQAKPVVMQPQTLSLSSCFHLLFFGP